MKILILGIGNTLKGDDGVGSYIVSKIKNIEAIDAGIIPENYIQKIIDSKPDRIIIIDAVDFGGYPGEVKWFNEIDSSSISISTHNLPPRLFIDFIKQQTGAEIKIIAIQPKQLRFNESLSEEVKKGADRLVEELCMKYMQSKT